MKRAISILTVIYVLIGVLANAYSQESALKDINEKIKIEDEKKFNINDLSEKEIDNYLVPSLLELSKNNINKNEIKEKYKNLDFIIKKYYLYFDDKEKIESIDNSKIIYFMFNNLKYDIDKINHYLEKYFYVYIKPIKLIEDFDNDGNYEILFDLQEFIDKACTFSIIYNNNGYIRKIDNFEGLRTHRGDYSFNKQNRIIVFKSELKNIYHATGIKDNKMVDYWQKQQYIAEYKYEEGKITKISGPTLIEGEMEIKFREETPPPGLTNKPAAPGQEKKQ